MKISFLCFDMSNNSFGRAALLAGALSKHYDVEILGPARQGLLWPPMTDTSLPVKLFPCQRFPKFIETARKILKEINGDIIFACKPRATSFGIGLLKEKETPLLVDIDDWELGFFYRKGFWSRFAKFLNFSNPNGLPYTWLMESLIGQADGITVSNRFLQNRFGGELAYHCRDTTILNPENFDKAGSKKKLGLEHKKTLMFLGTPRAHKGIEDAIRAMQQIKTQDAQLVLIGSSYEILVPFKKTIQIPAVPFGKLGEYLAAADIVLIPQRHTSDTVGQMPAKIFDAMAMAKPIISTYVSDIPEVLGGCGYLVEPGNVEQLAEAIDHAFAYEDEAQSLGQKARERCCRLYDTRVLEEVLLNLVRRTTKKKLDR